MTRHFTLPEAPSANRYWRHVTFKGRGSVTLLSAEARQYRKAVIAHVGPTVPMTGPLALTLVWYRSRRSGDLSNRLKQVEDALQAAGVFVNDSQITELHLYRRESPKSGRMEITISTVADEFTAALRRTAP